MGATDTTEDFVDVPLLIVRCTVMILHDSANRALGFIKSNSLVRPHVEYASAVWSPREVKTNPPTRDGPTSRSTMGTKPPPQHQHVGRPPMADVGTAAHRLQTGPTIPNYTRPSPDSTHQLSSTLTNNHISQKPQLCINNARQEQTILNIPSSPTPQWYGTTSPTSS